MWAPRRRTLALGAVLTLLALQWGGGARALDPMGAQQAAFGVASEGRGTRASWKFPLRLRSTRTFQMGPREPLRNGPFTMSASAKGKSWRSWLRGSGRMGCAR